VSAFAWWILKYRPRHGHKRPAIITQIQPISVIFTLPQDQLPQVFDKLHKNAAQLTVEAFDRDNTVKLLPANF
jgi:hypothetical protein